MSEHPRTRLAGVAHGVGVGPQQVAGLEDHSHHGNVEECRGKDAQGAAQIKMSEADAAGLFLLLQQERGDEVTGDDEEYLYAKMRELAQLSGEPVLRITGGSVQMA